MQFRTRYRHNSRFWVQNGIFYWKRDFDFGEKTTLRATTSSRITTNNNKNSSTKTDAYHGDDDDIDDNDKYTKIKTSNNHLSRKVFVFIALACTIAAYVCLVNITSNTINTRTINSRSTSIANTGIVSDLEHNAGIDIPRYTISDRAKVKKNHEIRTEKWWSERQ